MQVIRSELPGVLVLEPKVFGDARGFFYESFNARAFEQATGLACEFVQDNHSRSQRGVLRGLHYQVQQAQGKLVRVTAGEVFDVVVDLRSSSPSFGRWLGVHLSAENKRQVWVPEGFAHGFVTLSERAVFTYLCTATYDAAADANVRWDDPRLAIDWPVTDPQLSGKDAAAPLLDDVALDRLPIFST